MNNNNATQVVIGENVENFPQATCFGCQFLGHYHDQYPHAIRTAVSAMHVGHLFAKGPMFHVLKSWILFDACSTCDVSNSRELVTCVSQCSSANSLIAHTNGEVHEYEHLENLKLLAVIVHFKENSMATILSLKTVR